MKARRFIIAATIIAGLCGALQIISFWWQSDAGFLEGIGIVDRLQGDRQGWGFPFLVWEGTRIDYSKTSGGYTEGFSSRRTTYPTNLVVNILLCTMVTVAGGLLWATRPNQPLQLTSDARG